MSHDFPNPQNPHPQAQHHGGAAPHGAADLSALGPHGTPEHYETHQVYEHLPTEPSRPSAQVRLSIKLIYAHAVLIVVHGVVSFYRDTIPTSTTVYAQHGAAAMDVTIGKFAVLYTIITLVLVAINILVGVFYSRGYTWARITAAVLAILGAMNNLLLGLLTLIGVFELLRRFRGRQIRQTPGTLKRTVTPPFLWWLRRYCTWWGCCCASLSPCTCSSRRRRHLLRTGACGVPTRRTPACTFKYRQRTSNTWRGGS